MKRLSQLSAIVWLITLSFSALAAKATGEYIYGLELPGQVKAHIALTQSLKCPVCNGQTLYESNHPYAEAIKRDIAQRILEGKSTYYIELDYVKLYGEDMRVNPRFQTNTLMMWSGPLILFILAYYHFKDSFTFRTRAEMEARRHGMVPSESDESDSYPDNQIPMVKKTNDPPTS